jgi:solute carrier family 13 (sodium-dependent dicarboxylate transporter), member 2/3/5
MDAHPESTNPLRRTLLLGLLAVAAAVLTGFLIPGTAHPLAPFAGGIVVLMGMLWIFEVIPVAVTSLLPLVLFPLTGVLGIDETAVFYGESTIFLFLGGFLLALGLQESGVHRRIALRIVAFIGVDPARIVLGFMAATVFISMWVSNTATVMVMLPIAISVLEQAKSMGASGKDFGRFSAGIMLGIAYSADLGGMATIVGTAPNMVYRKLFMENFPGAPEPGFVSWMIMGVPLTLTLALICWVMLSFVLLRVRDKGLIGGKESVRANLAALGPIRQDEYMSVALFGLAVVLWVTGGEMQIGPNFHFLGWRKAFGLQEVDDAVVAIGCAILLFLIPSRNRKGEMLLNWERSRDVPWGVLLLFGGGFALAGGFKASGLSVLVGELFTGAAITSPILLLLLVCAVLIILTEIASNTAVTQLTLPILAQAAVAMGVDPRMLMIPATLAASCGFMMPVATPTHAIVYGTGFVKMRQMVLAGFWFDVVSLFLIPVIFMLVAKLAWGIDFDSMPVWATPPK